MKINYSGLIADEQCMKASSWGADEPVAHINVVQSLIDRLNVSEAENSRLHYQNEKLAEDLTKADALIRQIDNSWKEKCIEADTMRQHYENAHKVIQKLEAKA